MKKGNMLRAVIFLEIAGLCGCSLNSIDSENNDSGLPDAEAPIAVVDSLFDESALESGKTQTHFHTNNPQYWTWSGFSIWTVWDAGEQAVFTERTVELSKPNGALHAGYGLVICQGSRVYNGASVPTMLVVMINNNGQYSIGKVIGAAYHEMVWWTNSGLLQAGAGVQNELKIQYDGENQEFYLFINGSEERVFKDSETPVHYGGKSGYIVVISPVDNFPSKDVDVYFTENK
jgi:hypothetical protein